MDILGWLLVLGFTLRLTRFVITDKMGKWWVLDPIAHLMDQAVEEEVKDAELEGREPKQPWWWKYEMGLHCPYCVGFWIGALVLLSYVAWGHTDVWRIVATIFTLNWIAGHIGAAVGDAQGHDEDD